MLVESEISMPSVLGLESGAVIVRLEMVAPLLPDTLTWFFWLFMKF